MSSDSWAFVGVVSYFLLFIGGVVGLMIWKAKRKGGRLPVKVKLLRGPGETLQKRIAAFDDDFLTHVGGASLVPLAAALMVMGALIWLRPKMSLWIGLGITFAVFLATLFPAARWAMSRLARYRSDRTGYLGERLVGEYLQQLVKRGYDVFHDVPAEGKKSDFNLDHVTVGPTGVTVVETKTWRKGRRRTDGSEYRVSSDGQKLRWPWGEDFETMRQVTANADWLEQFIKKRTGIQISVKAVIAVPGWWVDEHARNAVAVVNEKNIASAIIGKGSKVLSEEQIDLIARQLDEKCRDVDY